MRQTAAASPLSRQPTLPPAVASTGVSRAPIKLTPADLGKLRIIKSYKPVPDVVVYKIPDAIQVLPHVACWSCGKTISSQSQAIREAIEAAQADSMKEKGRGMSMAEYSAVRNDIISSTGLVRPCCRSNAEEQFKVPDEVPRSVDRYVPGEGEMYGNVRIRMLPPELRYKPADEPGELGPPAIPYNPYTTRVEDILRRFEPTNDDTEPNREQGMPDKPKQIETLYPSMPDIDNEFTEEIAPVYKPEGREHVAGVVYTGVPGLESLLIRGRPIPAI